MQIAMHNHAMHNRVKKIIFVTKKNNIYIWFEFFVPLLSLSTTLSLVTSSQLLQILIKFQEPIFKYSIPMGKIFILYYIYI